MLDEIDEMEFLCRDLDARPGDAIWFSNVINADLEDGDTYGMSARMYRAPGATDDGFLVERSLTLMYPHFEKIMKERTLVFEKEFQDRSETLQDKVTQMLGTTVAEVKTLSELHSAMTKALENVQGNVEGLGNRVGLIEDENTEKLFPRIAALESKVGTLSTATTSMEGLTELEAKVAAIEAKPVVPPATTSMEGLTELEAKVAALEAKLVVPPATTSKEGVTEMEHRVAAMEDKLKELAAGSQERGKQPTTLWIPPAGKTWVRKTFKGPKRYRLSHTEFQRYIDVVEKAVKDKKIELEDGYEMVQHYALRKVQNRDILVSGLEEAMKAEAGEDAVQKFVSLVLNRG